MHTEVENVGHFIASAQPCKRHIDMCLPPLHPYLVLVHTVLACVANTPPGSGGG